MNTASNLATVEQAQELGLSAEEFKKIEDILGRTPNFTEMSVYSVMWSEHCSYKNSIVWLKKLPKEGPMMLAEAGEENAGLVDIGDGLACCFKIESHNHPSALEPYQGAATGVGGINRDIFSMGARPIAQLNSLRFGNIKTDRTKWLVKGVVHGISGYGNSFGIPTVGGEVYFDDCYETNILVNAMSAGIMKVGGEISAIAEGEGNPVYIFGAATGKDGIAGAAFASKDIGEDAMDDLPAVQVGDPFWEKLILEATMEIIETGAVVGLQDMGAAGITCSTAEMSAKSETGMRIDLSKVPLRQPNMKDWEILLSESQERMLAVVHKGREHEIEKILEKWDLTYNIIGEVTNTGNVEYWMDGEKKAEIPADSLALGGGAPVYHREWEEPAYYTKNKAFSIDQIDQPNNLLEVAKFISTLPNIASKKWVYEQYDSMVGTINQGTNGPSDASIVKIRDTKRSLALTTDCNSRYVWADPEKGTAIAVSEAARNIVCSGGTPSAVTNCLNFGNPYDKGVYWQFKNAILGMKAACEKFQTPVTGGNVSFYNQDSKGNAVFPTPTIGMIGIIDDEKHITTLGFKNEGDVIIMLGKNKDDINSSQYLVKYHQVENSPCPYFDLDAEAALQDNLLNLIKKGVVKSAHDCSEGGLFTALLESGMSGNLGFSAVKDESISRSDSFWFGEAQSRVVISVDKDEVERVKSMIKVPHTVLGEVTAGELSIDQSNWGSITDWKIEYDSALAKALA
ncbi:phosphoribosylformylglycinamidine synthase subunit PurL [Bacteroidia bacterium]|nr:phosphoribosylformylglycinamidine synthase subunit PurL [Bacteroidia bacterium]MDC0560546.1 phosphoribosylformylglycinamidine synthase subunit PurL [Bacteroidia bacterium]